MRRSLANGTLVTPEGLRRADLALERGRIAALSAHIAPGLPDDGADGSGCWVFPGFIDAHTHLQCWTGMDWTADSFETGTRAAACGGTTCIVDYATADRGVTMDEALAEWHARAEGGAGCVANYGFHMAIAEWGEDSPEQMRRMREAGVSSFKTYLAYDHLRLSDAETLRCLEVVRDLDAVLCVHCENGDVVNELQRKVLAEGITGPEGHPLSRPAEAEADAVSRLLYLAQIAGARVNVVHLSTELGLLAVRAARAFAMLRGTQTPAIAVSVYGNRDYDDALVETQDIIEAHGFKTVAAAAFIGRHCIFPKVAPGRPDADDMAKAAGFGADCARLLAGTDDAAAMPRLAVKGNRPYKQGGASTFSPAGTEETCSRCMTCASRCPMEAIPADKPWLTDGDKCIACGRCVVVCPERSRSFGGEAYRTFESKFVSAFSARREPETFFPENH